LLLGAEVHANVEFKELLEPPEDQRHSETTEGAERLLSVSFSN